MAMLAAFLISHSSFLISSAQTLNVTVGSVTDQYPAAQAGAMTYTGGTQLTILNKTYTLSDITKMEFSNDGTTGIDRVSYDFTITDDTEVYDLNGRRLPSTATLSRGIYIIKSNGKTTKVQVK